jgi:hypothetical protein
LLLVVCLGIVTYAPGLSTWSSRLVLPLSLQSVAASRAAPPPPGSEPAAPAPGTEPPPVSEAKGEDLDDLAAGGETLEMLLDQPEPPPPAAHDGSSGERAP